MLNTTCPFLDGTWSDLLDGKFSDFKCSFIYALDGTLLGTSKAAAPAQDEVKLILAAFSNPGNTQAKGIKLQGVKFNCLRASADAITATNSSNFFVANKTGQTIFFAVSDANIKNPPVVAESLADYIKSEGY